MKDKKKKKLSATGKRKHYHSENARLTQKNDYILTAKYRQEIRQIHSLQIHSKIESGIKEAHGINEEREKRLEKLIYTINSEIDQLIVEKQFDSIRDQKTPKIPIDFDERIMSIKDEFFTIFEKFIDEFDFGAFEKDSKKNLEEEKGFSTDLEQQSASVDAAQDLHRTALELLGREIIVLEEQLEKLEIRELADEKIQKRKIEFEKIRVDNLNEILQEKINSGF